MQILIVFILLLPIFNSVKLKLLCTDGDLMARMPPGVFRLCQGGNSGETRSLKEGGERHREILGPPSEREPVDTDSNSLCSDCPPSHSPCKVANHFYSNRPTCALRLTQTLVPAGFASTMSSYISKISTRSI